MRSTGTLTSTENIVWQKFHQDKIINPLKKTNNWLNDYLFLPLGMLNEKVFYNKEYTELCKPEVRLDKTLSIFLYDNHFLPLKFLGMGLPDLEILEGKLYDPKIPLKFISEIEGKMQLKLNQYKQNKYNDSVSNPFVEFIRVI